MHAPAVKSAHHLARRLAVDEDALPDFEVDEQPQRIGV
jgi:hypothetical protein